MKKLALSLIAFLTVGILMAQSNDRPNYTVRQLEDCHWSMRQ